MPCHQSSKDFAGHWRRPRFKRPTTNVVSIVEVYVHQMLAYQQSSHFLTLDCCSAQIITHISHIFIWI
jgi:hypothetical protein